MSGRLSSAHPSNGLGIGSEDVGSRGNGAIEDGFARAAESDFKLVGVANRVFLQSDLGRVPRASGAMTALGACLMATTPVGPGVDVLEVIVVTDTDDRGDQSTDLWDSQWDTLWLFAGLLIGAPFAASLARTTTRMACISRASVT